MKHGRLPGRVLIAALAPAGAAAAQASTVGATSSTSDAPIYIADKKGYFREEGLEAKVTNFRSAADMVAPLGIGQLDAGAGSAPPRRTLQRDAARHQDQDRRRQSVVGARLWCDQDPRPQGPYRQRPLQGDQ